MRNIACKLKSDKFTSEPYVRICLLSVSNQRNRLPGGDFSGVLSPDSDWVAVGNTLFSSHSAEREEMAIAYEVQKVRPDLQRLTALAHSATQATLATVALHWGELSPRELLIKAVRHKVVLLCRNWRWSQR